MLNTESRNAIGNLVNECRPGKARELELKVIVLLDDKLMPGSKMTVAIRERTNECAG